MAIASCPFFGPLWEEFDCCLYSLHQVFIHTGEILLSFVLSRLNSPSSQAHLLAQVLQTLCWSCGPLLCSFQYIHVSLVLGSLELGTAPQGVSPVLSKGLVILLMVMDCSGIHSQFNNQSSGSGFCSRFFLWQIQVGEASWNPSAFRTGSFQYDTCCMLLLCGFDSCIHPEGPFSSVLGLSWYDFMTWGELLSWSDGSQQQTEKLYHTATSTTKPRFYRDRSRPLWITMRKHMDVFLWWQIFA